MSAVVFVLLEIGIAVRRLAARATGRASSS